MAMYGLEMVTTSQGDGLIMTNHRDVFMFTCKFKLSKIRSDCKWSKEPYSLQISRIGHLMLPVPTSFLENC